MTKNCTGLGVLGMLHDPQELTDFWRQTHNGKLTTGIRANSRELNEGRFVAPGELGMVNPGKPVSHCHQGTAGSGNVGIIHEEFWVLYSTSVPGTDAFCRIPVKAFFQDGVSPQ